MKPQLVLSLAGLLMTFAPGCCVFEAIFGCHHWHGSGNCGYDQCGGDGCKDHKKCAKKCKKCRECLEEHGLGGGGYYSDLGMGGDCGCSTCGGGMMGGEIYGGDMGFGGGGGCGCSQGGAMPMGGTPYMTTPPMTVPTPGPTPMQPMPQSGTALPPPIPPIETGSTAPVPAGTQQVSVEEFQRLPGVVISGPGAPGTAASSVPQVSSQALPLPAPQAVAVPANAKPITSAATSAPPNARQVQQTGWAPVRR